VSFMLPSLSSRFASRSDQKPPDNIREKQVGPALPAENVAALQQHGEITGGDVRRYIAGPAAWRSVGVIPLPPRQSKERPHRDFLCFEDVPSDWAGGRFWRFRASDERIDKNSPSMEATATVSKGRRYHAIAAIFGSPASK
jgi:hypothetical protein